MKWDIFISHASEDKQSFVEPLAKLLSSYGVNVWFDKFTLKMGDSLSRSIDEGLINSKFGIVILSKSFFEKGWTDYELRGLLSKEIGYRKVILPIWHNINREDVMNHSPYLADKFALNTCSTDLENIALNIIELVRPDIYENYNRLITYKNLRNNSISQMISLEDINDEMPFRNDFLPLSMLLPIKVIQMIFYDILPISFEDTVNSFKKDTNPDREILIWCRIAGTYLEFINNKNLSLEKRKDILSALLMISTSYYFGEIEYNNFNYISKEDIEILSQLYNSIVPGVSLFHTDMYARQSNNRKDTI